MCAVLAWLAPNDHTFALTLVQPGRGVGGG